MFVVKCPEQFQRYKAPITWPMDTLVCGLRSAGFSGHTDRLRVMTKHINAEKSLPTEYHSWRVPRSLWSVAGLPPGAFLFCILYTSILFRASVTIRRITSDRVEPSFRANTRSFSSTANSSRVCTGFPNSRCRIFFNLRVHYSMWLVYL